MRFFGINRSHLFQIFVIFILTRGLIYVFGVYSYAVFPERGTIYVKKHIHHVTDLEKVWGRWDSNWYERLAEEGYPQRSFSDKIQETWGFMPLYSILMRAFSDLSGLPLFLSGIIISNLCTFLALLVLYKLFEERYSKGIQGVMLMLISAGSFYLSIAYTEGLFLLLTTFVFYLSNKNKLGWALLAAGFASVTRIQGCLLFVIPGIELVLNHRRELHKHLPWMMASLVPMAVFMWYLYETCGEPLAFIKIQHAWGSQQLIPLQGFMGMFKGIRPGASLVHTLFWSMIMFITLSSYRKLPLSYIVFTVLYFLLSTSNSSLYGSTRYMLGILPVFAGLVIGSDRIRHLFILINLMFLSFAIIDFITNSMIFL